MLAKGNGNVEVCASNVLKMKHYDLHIICDMGLDPAVIDSDADIGIIKLDAAKALKNFEKRANITSLNAEQVDNRTRFWFGLGEP